MKKFLLLLALAIIPCRLHAQTITAASCSQSDVQAAFNSVVAATRTVLIPACPSGNHWTTFAGLTIPAGSTTLTIQGSTTVTGNCTPNSPTCTISDQTVIIDDIATDNGPLGITTNNTSTSLVRVTGLTVQGGSGVVKDHGMVGMGGLSANVRFDHNHLNASTYGAGLQPALMRWTGCIYGVLDHNVFDMTQGSVQNGIQVDNAGSCFGDSAGNGDQSWANPTALGTATFLYVENNVFNNGASNDCTNGGRFVMRYNIFNTSTPPPTVQTHPTGGAGRIRGCRAWEIYGNAFDAESGQYIETAWWASAGTGVVWGNTLPSSSAGGGTGYKNFIGMHSMRRDNSTYGQTATPNGWGYAGTSFDGVGSNWDQNSNTSTGYRPLDVVGVGQGDLLTGGFTLDGSGSNNVTNAATGCISTAACAWPRQASEPMYEWLDNFSCVPSNPCNFQVDSDSGSYVANSDFYLWCNAASGSGCTTFNGTVGTGSGLLASRPATCTVGVAYWASDSGSAGTLYKCTATNTWTSFYQPYTYPHPLEGGSPPPTVVLGTSRIPFI